MTGDLISRWLREQRTRIERKRGVREKWAKRPGVISQEMQRKLGGEVDDDVVDAGFRKKTA